MSGYAGFDAAEFVQKARSLDGTDELSIYISRQLMMKHALSLIMLTLQENAKLKRIAANLSVEKLVLEFPKKQKPRGRLWLNDGSCVQ